MKNSFVLILSSIFFQGFIIACEGVDVSKNGESPKVANQPRLPSHLMADIIFRAGYETTLRAANAGAHTQEVIEKMFQNHIIVLEPKPLERSEDDEEDEEDEREIIEYEEENERYLKIRNYEKLMKLFKRFGKYVRRIHVYYYGEYDMDGDMRHGINDKIIKKYKNQLTELFLCITCYPAPDNEHVWEEISNENGEIRFPNVKKFIYSGLLKRNPFDVNAIFPQIEIFRFTGDLQDKNFLKNVRKLKELYLNTGSIGEKELLKIIANNKGITKLAIGKIDEMKISALTVQSIAENLKSLKSLEVRGIKGEFLVPKNNRVFNLPLVNSFGYSGETEILHRNLSIDMPNLEKLKVIGGELDGDVAKFINRFRKLKTLYLDDLFGDNAISCVKHFIHIKEFVTFGFTLSQLTHVEALFKNFNKSSKLDTIKWLHFDESEYPHLEVKMKEISKQLGKSGKPTWKLSNGHEEYEGQNTHYLMLKRDP